MSGPQRFAVIAPLPPHGEWRRALALDRSGDLRNGVVLAFVPAAILDDPTRLAALVRDVEAACRLHHPAAMPVLGTETVDDALAVVEPYRPAVTLRALLDAGGRLPADVAARIVVDACAAVARAHALDTGEGRKLVHGAIAPSRIVVGEDGSALVVGFGTSGAAEPARDVHALASVLYECLEGDPPGPPPAPLDGPGIPPPLAAAVARVLGAAPGETPSASALAEAVAAGGPIASHADVAAYVDAILPPGEGARGELSRALATALGVRAEEVSEEVSEDFIVEPTEPGFRPRPAETTFAPRAEPAVEPTPAETAFRPATMEARRGAAAFAPGQTPAEPTPEPLPRPPATRPGADPVGVFAAPAPAPSRSRAPAVVAVVCAALGFGAGFVGSRLGLGFGEPGVRSPVAGDAARAAAPPDAGAAPASDERKARPAARPPGPGPGPEASATAGRPAAKKSAAKTPARAAAKAPGEAAAPVGKGMLKVTAPEDAEVFLDGRRVGRGNVETQIVEGAHRIEVRRGEARVAESFTLAPGETWTYDVTPTP